MATVAEPQAVWTGDPELDPALQNEFYEEPGDLKARLDRETDLE